MLPVTPTPPQPGQESVWDYPRPAVCEPCTRHIRVVFAGMTIADSHRTVRALETSHPPVYFIPPTDIAMQHLEPTDKTTFCEWKGVARYFTVRAGSRTAENAAFAYPTPEPGFARIMDHIAFYARPMDACFVDGEQVTPQPGGFYAGWITAHVAGPFKGAPGSEFW